MIISTRNYSTVVLKLPCHAFPVITRPLVCYEGCYAYKRSAESKTLKVHPVASKTLTQKTCLCCPRTPRWRFLFFHLFLSGNQNGPIRGAPHTPGGVGTISVHFQLTGSPLVGNRRVGIAEKCSPQTHSHSGYKPFSYSISSHTYCFYFGCECLCVLRMSFACIAVPKTCPLLAADRSSEPRNVPTNQSTQGV